MLREGIYEEIINNKLREELSCLDNASYQIGKESIDVEEARKILSVYISSVTRRALKYIRENSNDDRMALIDQITTCNDIISILTENLDKDEFESLKIAQEGEVLTSLYSRINNVRGINGGKIVRPLTPISQSSLFTGSHYEPSMLEEIKREIISSDAIDMLISFIKWSGLRCIIEELKDFTQRRKGRIRIITTSYMEATDYRAILELCKLENTEIKISYDVNKTRLHAKAYMFKRETGFSTAYIGSSNLSNPALTAGLEWNLKVTEKDSFDVIKKFEATFESYWNDSEFKCFDGESERDRENLQRALHKKNKEDNSGVHFNFDINPYPYQKEILEKLQVEREVFGRVHNLLVAATGVGKTVIAAFDYKRFCKNNKNSARLLFVAHREEILKQNINTFRMILRDFNFGDLLVGGSSPDSIDHLFISIQSFNSTKLQEKTSKDFFDFIIIDEFHHAAADSYQILLDYYQPKVLLGLTATPERMDGKDILQYFEDTIASEMRLTEAIDRKLLCPFQFFCVTDTVDLSNLKWSRKGYDIKELEHVYTADDIRSKQVIRSIYKYVTDIDEVKGLGFCVSIEHAKYMAKFFNNAKIPSLALYAGVDSKTRNDAKSKLIKGEIKFIFVVDLYNEGVDIPEINTILFLRPTESLTVFLQQFGRGLRLSEGKECLTVLDFVGQAHRNYNFDEKFRALVGKTRHSIKHYLEQGFFNLPRGCFIQLEKQAKEYVLRNIRESANTRSNLVSKMKHFYQDTGLELNLRNFLKHHNLSLYEFYGKNGDRTFRRMLVEAGLKQDFTCLNEHHISKKLLNLLFVNSLTFIRFLIEYIKGKDVFDEDRKLMLSMFYYSFYNRNPELEGFKTIEEGLQEVLKNSEMREEILEILNYNYENIDIIEVENDFEFLCPLKVHSKYSTSQILAALGNYTESKSPSFREGVKYFEDKALDIFFITLNKSEKDFSPSTLYEDYAINERLFHWQTQSRISENSNTAQRYIKHRELGNKIALFVREYKVENGYTAPFVFLGSCEYIKHSGDKPISFIWKLKEEMPPMFVPRANKNIL